MTPPLEMINMILAVVMIDATSVLLLGYYDLKYVEFPIIVIFPYLIIPAILYYMLWSTLQILIATLSLITAVFVILMYMGYMGYLDIVVAVRIPFILLLMIISNPLYPVLGFGAGSTLAFIYFYLKYIKPILCGKSAFRTVTKVWREAIMLNYVFPANVHMEISPEKLAEIKKKILDSGEECIEATVGIPYIFVFAIGYALSVLAIGIAELL